MKYKLQENQISYQNRKGLTYEITPRCKYSIIEEETTFTILDIPDFVQNQKEVGEMIVNKLNG
jgi:hypothetical protein